MNIGLFGGFRSYPSRTPQRGSLPLGDSGCEIWFVPADIPPHKLKTPITSYFHRYSMVVLALANEPDFLPSLLEAPDRSAAPGGFTIDTVPRSRRDCDAGTG